MGRNGTGKSTMLKALLANAPDVHVKRDGDVSGKVVWGHEAQIGYFEQDHRETIKNGMTVFEWLNEFDPAGHPRGTPRLAGPHALRPGGRRQAHRRPLRR